MIALLLVASLAPALAHASDEDVLTHGPVLGDVTADGFTVWARAARPGRVALDLATPGGDVRLVSAAREERDLTVRWRVEGLAPGSSPTYTIEAAGAAAGPFTVELLPADPRRTSIAFGSCADDRRYPSQPIWTRMAEAGAEAVVLLGDTPYVDSTDLDVQRARYREFFAVPELAALMSRVPFYSTWDDHDFGRNDTDGNLAGKEGSRAAFREYHPNPSFGEGGVGVYTRFRRGPIEVFLLDTRWFAGTEPSFADPDAPTLLGAAQWAWLRRGLAASDAPFKVLACGMVWNGAVRPLKSDHWARYPHERAALFEWIGREGVEGVVLVGGDIHRSRVLRHDTEASAGYVLTELITSPLANFVIDLANQPHEGLVWDAGISQVVLLLEATERDGAWTLAARYLDAAGAEVHRLELPAADLSASAGRGPVR